MPKKKTQKAVKTVTKKTKKTETLVWKRTKRGRPKKEASAKTAKPAAKKRAEPVKKQTPVAPKPVAAKKTLPPDSELTVEQSKFNIGPKQNAGEFQTHNIPFEYGKNRVVLLVVGPKFAFLYWEVQNDRINDALNTVGHNAKLTLRFHEANSRHSWDISIYERVGNWYLRLDHPEQLLVVDIGMKNDRGEFYKLASSMPMKLPSMGLAKRGPIKWMLVSPTGEKVVTEIEEYTDADYELLKKILGPYFFDLLRKGKFAGLVGSSAENVFTNIGGIRPSS